MAELGLIKGPGQVLLPLSSSDEIFVTSLKTGQLIRGEFRKARNERFHKKFMKLCSVAYNVFEESLEPQRMGGSGEWFYPETDFDEFRYWATVKAGFYNVIGYPDGGVRVRAKSIKFSQMDQVEFEKVYSRVLDVLIRWVLMPRRGWSRQKVDDLVEKLIHFD